MIPLLKSMRSLLRVRVAKSSMLTCKLRHVPSGKAGTSPLHRMLLTLPLKHARFGIWAERIRTPGDRDRQEDTLTRKTRGLDKAQDPW